MKTDLWIMVKNVAINVLKSGVQNMTIDEMKSLCIHKKTIL